MHLLLTGGTGFFGKALLRYWKMNPNVIAPYDRITILTRNPEGFLASNGDLISGMQICMHKGDILFPQTLIGIPAVSHVLHAATDSTNGPLLSPLERYQQIVKGTQNILDFSVQHKVTKFLLTSSGGVYGPQPVDMVKIPETYCGMPDPLDPNAAYSVSKRIAEHLCALYSDRYGLDFVIARCFAFVGQDLPLNVHFAIGNFIRDALYSKEIQIKGDGNTIRSYLYQEDLAEWLMLLLITSCSSRVFNVGSDEQISILNLAEMIRDIMSPNKNIKILGGLTYVNSNTRSRYVPDIDKIKNELNLSIKFDIKHSIINTIRSLNA